MSLWTSTDAAKATGGQTGDWAANGISIDTRTLKEGDLFIALKGPNSDGHDYVASAFDKGAAAAMVDHIPEGVDKDKCLLVEDTLKALADLGHAARARTDAIYIAVTGSVGKTSTKDMLECAFSEQFKTHASQKSYNNHWGVPLTLALMPQDTEIGIFEIGMNHAGEISPLAKMVKPHVAMVTTVEAVHIENFENGEEGVAHAKAEIFDGLSESGIAIIKKDNQWCGLLGEKAQAQRATPYYFGQDPTGENNVHAPVEHINVGADVTSFETHINNGVDGKINVKASGEHHAYNMVAVLLCAAQINTAIEYGAIASDLRIDMDLFEYGLSKWQQRDGRGKQEKIVIKEGHPPVILIDEHYNASPIAMRAAFKALSRAPVAEGGRRIAVLGDMAELGDDVAKYHTDLAPDLLNANVDLLFAAGPNMTLLYNSLPEDKRAACAEIPSDLCEELKKTLKAGDAVLIKGSRGGAEKPKMLCLVECLVN